MTRTKIKCVFTLGAITCLTCSVCAQKPPKSKENDPVSFEASYIGDNVNNTTGGIRTGTSYLGMANITVGFNTETARLWKGGCFFVNVANTHGDEPSAGLIGDVQVVSNIEAGDHTFFQELWISQKIGKTEIIAGLQDLNAEFASSEYGALYLNSSFGILPIISNNFNASIFPLTTLGLTHKWDISEKYTWLNAIYDGSPTNFDYNPYNLKWQFNSGEGLLLISEIQRYINIRELPGIYKLGAYTHFHIKGNITPYSPPNKLLGLYAYIDQGIWEQEDRSAGVFVQLGYSPSEASTNNAYVGLGANYVGLLSKKGRDVIGLACAHVAFTRNGYSETAIELTYKYLLTCHIFIQPDFQYIVNPSGTGGPLPNALTANFRFGFNF